MKAIAGATTAPRAMGAHLRNGQSLLEARRLAVFVVAGALVAGFGWRFAS